MLGKPPPEPPPPVSSPEATANKLTFGEAFLSKTKLGLIIAGFAIILTSMALARLDEWIFRNETFNNLAFGFNVSASHPSLVTMREAAINGCRGAAELQELKSCINYQSVITSNLYLAHPIASLFGVFAKESYADTARTWLPSLQMIAVSSQLTSAVFAILLCLLLLASLPPESRLITATIFIALAFLGFSRADSHPIVPDPLSKGIQVWEAFMLPIVALVFGWTVHYATSRKDVRALLVPSLDQTSVKLLLGISVALIVLNLSTQPVTSPFIQAIAFGCLVWVLTVMMAWGRIPPVVAAAVGLFLFLMITSDQTSFIRRLELGREQCALVFGLYCAYLTLRPQGRLIWILPLLLLIHVAAVSVLVLALILAELPLSIRRRRFSPVLLPAFLTLALGLFLTSGNEFALNNPTLVAYDEVFSILLQPVHFWPGLVVFFLILGLSASILIERSERWDRVSWAGFLCLQAVGAVWISYAIRDTLPTEWIAPEFFLLVTLVEYLNPALTLGASLSLLVFLGSNIWNETGTAERRYRPPALPMIRSLLLVTLLLGATKMELTLRPVFSSAVKIVYDIYIDRSLDPRWCRHLQAFSGDDDRYYLSPSNPTNNPMIYFSKLKLKIRIALGLHDPQAMIIEVREPGDEDCVSNSPPS